MNLMCRVPSTETMEFLFAKARMCYGCKNVVIRHMESDNNAIAVKCGILNKLTAYTTVSCMEKGDIINDKR
jgi:hypothetical protein